MAARANAARDGPKLAGVPPGAGETEGRSSPTARRRILTLTADIRAPERETEEVGAPRVVSTPMSLLGLQFAARINLAFEPGEEGHAGLLGEFATIVGGVELVSANAPKESSAILTRHTDTDL